jgi:hypothetical protein
VLSGALFVAESMHRKGQSVLVHCSDGWDRTAQVCGLVQLMLDPFFRTIRGFCILIAKEWAAFGFKFHQRCGHANEKSDDTDISPIFVQWLDAVYQLVKEFPFAFEFNQRTLLAIAHHVHSCRFGDFLFNCERERAEARLPFRTHSLWEYLLEQPRVMQLVNPSYDPSRGDVLLPHPAALLRSVAVWDDWFLRWSPFPSMSESAYRMERYPAAVYSHARVAAISVARQSARAGADASDDSAAAALNAHVARLLTDPLTGTPLEAIPSVTAADASHTAATATPDSGEAEVKHENGAGNGHIEGVPTGGAAIHLVAGSPPADAQLFETPAHRAAEEEEASLQAREADEPEVEATSFLPKDDSGDDESTDNES